MTAKVFADIPALKRVCREKMGDEDGALGNTTNQNKGFTVEVVAPITTEKTLLILMSSQLFLIAKSNCRWLFCFCTDHLVLQE